MLRADASRFTATTRSAEDGPSAKGKSRATQMYSGARRLAQVELCADISGKALFCCWSRAFCLPRALLWISKHGSSLHAGGGHRIGAATQLRQGFGCMIAHGCRMRQGHEAFPLPGAYRYYLDGTQIAKSSDEPITGWESD
jgi:hypothetical protein